MSDIAAGEIVVARDEDWLVRSCRTTGQDETRLEVTDVSELVRDQNAVFYDTLDLIERVDLRSLRPRLLIGDAAGLGKALEIGVLLAELLQACLRGAGCGILLDRSEAHPDGGTDPALGFIRPDREAEMRAAYAEFVRRLGQ